MRPEDLRAFAERDWEAGLESEVAARRERKARLGVGDSLALADSLRRHIQSIRPDWPSQEDREEDAETHLRVQRMLASVSTASLR